MPKTYHTRNWLWLGYYHGKRKCPWTSCKVSNYVIINSNPTLEDPTNSRIWNLPAIQKRDQRRSTLISHTLGTIVMTSTYCDLSGHLGPINLLLMDTSPGILVLRNVMFGHRSECAETGLIYYGGKRSNKNSSGKGRSNKVPHIHKTKERCQCLLPFVTQEWLYAIRCLTPLTFWETLLHISFRKYWIFEQG